MTNTKVKLIRMWLMGLVLFGLRFYQLRYDFDSETLLHETSPVGVALAVLVAVAGVLLFILSRWESREKAAFSGVFGVPGRRNAVLIAGAGMLAIGGVLPVVFALKNASPVVGILDMVNAAEIAAAVLAAAASLGFIALTAQMRRGEVQSVVPVLPAVFFGAFWVLSLYIPTAEDPVMARYYLPILAAAVTAYAFAELGGFFRGETKVRNFSFVAEYAVVLCIASSAALEAGSLMFAGCALILSVFISLQKKAEK